MAFEKIMNHPDRNEIVRWLTKGYGVRKVSRLIRERHPDDKHLHITPCTLQMFRKKKLNIEGDALEAIKVAEKGKQIEKVKEKKLAEKENFHKKLPAYKEKIQEALNLHVEIRQELSELLVLIKARTADLFDRAANGEITINEEANLQKYFQAWTVTVERWAKYIEKIADKTVETNVNITVIENQMAVIREAILETFQELAPELAPKFLEKLNYKMETLNYRNSPKQTVTEMHEDTQILSLATQAIDAEIDDGEKEDE